MYLIMYEKAFASATSWRLSEKCAIGVCCDYVRHKEVHLSNVATGRQCFHPVVIDIQLDCIIMYLLITFKWIIGVEVKKEQTIQLVPTFTFLRLII